MTAGLTCKVVTKSGNVRHCYRNPATGKQMPHYVVTMALRLSETIQAHLDATRSALSTHGMEDAADDVVSFAIARLSAPSAKSGRPHGRGNDVSAKVARDLESLGIKPPNHGGEGEKVK